MTPTIKFQRIALLHHVSGSNLGDSGTFEAVLHNIRKRWPDAEVIGLTMNPADTLKRHGVRSYPIRQQTWSFGGPAVGGGSTFKGKVKTLVRRHPFALNLLRVARVLFVEPPCVFLKELRLLVKSLPMMRSVDLLIICGGGQFLESCGSPWKFAGGPYQFTFTIFKWILLAKFGGGKIMILNVGAGPLVRPLTKLFVRGSLALSNYNTFRDEESRALINSIGFKSRTYVFPDSAYSLEMRCADEYPAGPATGSIVGFAPMAYGDPRLSPTHDPAIYNEFIQRFGMFGSSLVKKGYFLRLFCTDISVDPPAVVDVENILRVQTGPVGAGTPSPISRVHQWTTAELLENMSAMDYVVAVRFHAVVFAHMLNKPVLAISHHPKVMALMNDLGLSEYCVDIRTCEPAVLAEKFASLAANRDQIKKRMAEKLASNQHELSVQFDELFPFRSAYGAHVFERPVGQLRALSSLATFLIVGLIGVVDYITGVEVSCSVLYLLAIGSAAWFEGRNFAILTTILSVLVSLCADVAGGAHFSSLFAPDWNAISLISLYLALFLVVVWLLATLRSLQRKARGAP